MGRGKNKAQTDTPAPAEPECKHPRKAPVIGIGGYPSRDPAGQVIEYCLDCGKVGSKLRPSPETQPPQESK